MPALDQTRTVGLVTLPNAFVGMLLGGASPAVAARSCSSWRWSRCGPPRRSPSTWRRAAASAADSSPVRGAG
ncbi:ABC transporter permease [Nonomuraea sp. NPDC050451]|uniref:ABC transporter permease n=1 Tax=Nonomuraea sp. NPDC050451 TaxID=3364364 RepID=UPI00379ABD07